MFSAKSLIFCFVKFIALNMSLFSKGDANKLYKISFVQIIVLIPS
jgi:hypothetical protein